MYLAYDLLGGKHSPLRTLTRVVTYGLFFGIGLGLPLALSGSQLETAARLNVLPSDPSEQL